MAGARTCALGVALLLLVCCSWSHAAESKARWSRPVQEAEGRSDWIPVAAPFQDSEASASAQHEEVATVLRPPAELGNVRHQRLVQTPRQGRGPQVVPQQYFPGDQTHLIRFPQEQIPPQLRNPQFPQNFHQPQFLPPQPVPAGFPPQALTQSSFQPQPIPVFNPNVQSVPVRPLNNSFVPAGPQEEVQLVYVPVEALQGQKGVLNKQKVQPTSQFNNNNNNPGSRDQSFQDQLRQFVQQQGPKPLLNGQEQFQVEQQRLAQIREQEERQRIKDQERKERLEQEEKLRKEQEIKERQERQEIEQRLRKEQELREQEVFRKIQADKDAKNREERERHEANLRFQQQQQQEFQQRPPQEQFASPTPPSLQAQEHAFQHQLDHQAPTEAAGPAPHQPPLAVYMSSPNRDPAAIEDVLFALRDAETIPVLDRVPSPKSTPPQVFVGPAEMTPPEGYTKFELPYLSSLEGNRVERKVDQLPFFVAPLSFQPPTGYSKIPFPHPHVGSVVVSHGRQRPLHPEPQVIADEYTSSELPSISPAIPLLVNSLQNGRGAKHQRPHVQQQFVDQQQFVPQGHQQFVPQEQQPFQQPEYVPFTPQYEEDQPITTDVPEPPPTLAAPAFSRRPLNSRGRTRLPAEVAPTPVPRRKAPARETAAPEHRPRGRRPGGRTRTTPQPIVEDSFDNTREVIRDDQPEVQQASPTPPQFEQQQFVEPQFNHQSFDPQAFPTYQGQFQHQQVFPANVAHQPVVQQNFNVPSNHASHPRGNFAAPTPTQVYEAEQEVVSEQAEIDSSSYDNQRFESPKKTSASRLETPRPRQPDPSPAVSTEEPTFQRSRPTVFQPVVSSTPPSLLSRQSVSPFISSTAYPSETPSITPHHVVKGEVGKVKQQVNFPFIPTPLPDYPSVSEESQASPSPSPASPEQEQHQFFVEPTTEVPTVAPTEEPQRIASPSPASLSYQTPSRQRGRVTQHSGEQTDEPTRITPRPRVRPQTESSAETTPSYQSSQRFRGRGQTSREEGSDEPTSQQPAQRTRTRVHTGRGRGAYTTTESPGLQITVPDFPRQSDDSQGETPITRTRPRFRGAVGERVRGSGARQQQITRGRQPARQQDNENLELTKPVRQQVGSASDTPVIDSPVYVPDVQQYESGFVPAIDSQKALPTSTEAATEVTTVRPGRQRFNNFGSGTRRRQQARTTTVNQDTTTAAPITSGRAYTVRTSRRQQTTQQPGTSGTRGTSVRGSRVRRPNSSTTTTEAPEEEEEVPVVPVSTGVTYIKNPYVTIQRPGNDPPATANEVQEEEVQAAPVQSRFRQRPQPVDEESYVDAPASRYDASPVEPEYQQYYSPSPTPARATQRQEQHFTASTPAPSHKPKQLVATPTPQFLREEPQQYHREEFEYQPQQPQRQHRQRNNNPRYVTLDDPEYGGEESQRSEQISIQQLEGAIAASLFNKALENAEVVDEDEEPENVELSEEVEQKEQESVPEHEESEPEQESEEEEHATEENVTEQETTEQPLTTTSDEEVSQSAPVSAEPEEASEKPALHAKPSEGKRRRIRIRARKQQQKPGDVFETAESQNVASVASNLLNQQSVLHNKEQTNLNNNEWKLSLPNYPTIALTSEGNIDDEENYNLNQDSDNVQFTTSDLPDHTEETKVTEVTTEETVAETTTSVPEVDLKTRKVTEGVASTTEAPVTTVTEPMTAAAHTDDLSTQAETTTEFAVTTDTAAPPSTPRVLGTSTTTEISLETEICYRGRCVKTKVDADQMPIE